jgi:surface polysaccharide O-acyltransferase-like enzyme
VLLLVYNNGICEKKEYAKLKVIMEKNSYNFSADIIRVLAILGVVIIHTANAVYGRPDFFGGISWWLAIVLNSASRASIPLFIMLSGYLLLSKNETFEKSFKRTITRLVTPLVFWFLIFVIWNGGNPTFMNVNETLIYRLLSVNVFALYFFIILIGLYFVAPIIRGYLHNVDHKSQRNFAIFAVIAGCAMYFFEYIYNQCSPANSLTYFLPYTGLFVTGYIIGNASEKIRKVNVITSIYITSLLITIVGAYFYYMLSFQGNNLLSARGCLSFYTDSFLSINVVGMALAAFALLMHCNFKRLATLPLVKKLFYSIARTSMGIYIIHLLLLDILDSRLRLFDPIAPAWLYIVIKLFVIFSLSYIITLVLMKIPLIKRTLGENK